MPAPPPPLNGHYRDGRRIAVLLGPASGAKPALSDRVDYLVANSVDVGLGGGSLDAISLTYDIPKTADRLQDTALIAGYNRTVEVRVENPTNGKLDTLLGWGKLAAQPQLIDANTESVGMTARLDHFLFGDRLIGYRVKNVSGGTLLVRKPIVFNPVIDHLRLPNRSDQVDSHGARLFLEPESMRTAGAVAVQAAVASFWDLRTAVFSLCWLLNPSETWIKNPTLVELQAVFGIGSALLQNHEIPLGSSLPDALDKLLPAHGYTWRPRYSIDTSDPLLPATTTITVHKRGDGLPMPLKLQRIDDPIDGTKTTIDSLRINYDWATRPNVIVGYSGLQRREVTVPLRPAWPQSSDSLTKAELDDEHKQHDREHIDVYAKFVCDTSGDYSGVRDDFIGGPVDLEPVFGVVTVPMRRRLEPALTQGLDRRPLGENGYLLEWHNGREWIKWPGSFSVLQHEAGVTISGLPDDFRAEFLKKARSVAAGSVPPPILRITCTLIGDDRTSYTAARRPESANGVDVPAHYDLSHKFQDARVVESGTFASVLYPDRHEAITAATVGGATSSVTVAVDLTSVLKPGDRVSIVESTDNDGENKVVSVTLSGTDTVILLETPIASTTADGVLCYLTEEEKPDTPLADYCDGIQQSEDFVLIKADATLFGIDHPEYVLGNTITKVESRNLSLDSHAAAAVAQAHPQITRIRYDLSPNNQSISLTLDQHDKAADRKQKALIQGATRKRA